MAEGMPKRESTVGSYHLMRSAGEVWERRQVAALEQCGGPWPRPQWTNRTRPLLAVRPYLFLA